MAISRPLRLPNVTNVGSNQSFTIGLPVGNQTYESVNLGLTDIAKNKIRNLEVRINGKPIQRYKSVEDLEAISKYYGYHIAASEVEVPFFREHFTSAAQARTFNLGVNGVSTAEVVGEIDTLNGGSPAIKAYAPRYVFPTPEANQVGSFTKISNFVKATATTGRFEISDLPLDVSLQAIHMKSDKIAEVRLELDNNTVWELDKNKMKEYLLRKGRTPQDGWYHMDWMLTNEIGGQMALRGLQDFRLVLEMEAPDEIDIYLEYWTRL